jgi:hypothetical protein
MATRTRVRTPMARSTCGSARRSPATWPNQFNQDRRRSRLPGVHPPLRCRHRLL